MIVSLATCVCHGGKKSPSKERFTRGRAWNEELRMQNEETGTGQSATQCSGEFMGKIPGWTSAGYGFQESAQGDKRSRIHTMAGLEILGRVVTQPDSSIR